MPLLDHLGLTVEDLDRAFAQWNPLLTALGCTPEDGELEGDDNGIRIEFVHNPPRETTAA